MTALGNILLIDFNIRFNLQNKWELTALQTDIYKHENDEIARYISLIISVIKKFRFSKKIMKFQENSGNFKKMHEHFENKIIENLFDCSLLQCVLPKIFIRSTLSLTISEISTFYIKTSFCICNIILSDSLKMH